MCLPAYGQHGVGRGGLFVVEMTSPQKRKNGTTAKPQAPKGGKGRPVPSVPNPKRPR